MSDVDSRHFFVAMVPPKATKQEAKVMDKSRHVPCFCPSTVSVRRTRWPLFSKLGGGVI